MNTSTKSMAMVALLALVVAPLAAAATDVTITVVDKDGDEIENARVTLTYKGNDTIVGGCDEDETDSDGEADCDDLEDGDDYQLEIAHDDYKDIDDDEALEDYDEDDEEILVVMRPKEFDLDVTVEDQDEEGIEDANVKVVSLDEDIEEDDIDPDGDYDVVVFPDEKSKYEAFGYDEDDDTDGSGEVEFRNLEFNTLYNITVTKSGYLDTDVEHDFPDEAEDDALDIEMIEPGTATFTATVRDQETGEFIEGATVTVVSREDDSQGTGSTNSEGQAGFTLDTPACYDIAVTKGGYSTDSQTELCLSNDADATSPFYLISQNNPPVAEAGEDQHVMIGDSVTLDGSGSSDPDGDELTYAWTDSIEIPDEVSPQVVFESAGEYAITLTVSDGRENSTDEVTVQVETPENCGDGICSLAEDATGTCPEDCPVCQDDVCGAGEADGETEFYCPVDCGIAVSFTTLNQTPLTAGNTTSIVAVDPQSGAPVAGAAMSVTQPNGTVTALEPVAGQAQFTFGQAGTYTLAISAEQYAPMEAEITVHGGGLDGIWLWIAVIVVAAVAVLLLIRFINTRGGKSGYRAKNFRRRKPSLRSV